MMMMIMVVIIIVFFFFFTSEKEALRCKKRATCRANRKKPCRYFRLALEGLGQDRWDISPPKYRTSFPPPYSPANPELPSYGGQVHSQCESFARFGSCQGYGARVRVGNEWKRVAGVHNQSGIFFFFFFFFFFKKKN